MSKCAENIGKAIAVLFTVAASTFLSGFAGLMGAKLGGLQEGGWNWQFMPPVFVGLFVGFFLSIILFLLLRAVKDFMYTVPCVCNSLHILDIAIK